MFTWNEHKIIMLPSTEAGGNKKTAAPASKPVLFITRIDEEFMSEMKVAKIVIPKRVQPLLIDFDELVFDDLLDRLPQ